MQINLSNLEVIEILQGLDALLDVNMETKEIVFESNVEFKEFAKDIEKLKKKIELTL